jgi:hypothetical protein
MMKSKKNSSMRRIILIWNWKSMKENILNQIWEVNIVIFGPLEWKKALKENKWSYFGFYFENFY